MQVSCAPLVSDSTDRPKNDNHTFNPFRTKTPKHFFQRGNKPLLYHQIGNRNSLFSLQISKTWMFCVDKIKYEHLTILSNLKSCQFAPRIVIFNLCICCQFEDSQSILSKNSYEPSQHLIMTNEGSFFAEIFSFFWYIIQNF